MLTFRVQLNTISDRWHISRRSTETRRSRVRDTQKKKKKIVPTRSATLRLTCTTSFLFNLLLQSTTLGDDRQVCLFQRRAKFGRHGKCLKSFQWVLHFRFRMVSCHPPSYLWFTMILYFCGLQPLNAI